MLGSNNPVPLGRSIVQAGIPFVVPSSGTMGNNGALSGIAAVPSAYPSAYVFLPANAISAGSAAGLYYAVFSSTTAATVYNNTYTSGQPTVPASPTAFVTTGPGAFTQVTTEVTLITATIPANALGLNGRTEARADYTWTSSANTKTPRIRLGVTAVYAGTSSTSTGAIVQASATNRNNASSQKVSGQHLSSSGAVAYSAGTAAIDTTANADLTITLQNSSATETQILESYQVLVFPKG